MPLISSVGNANTSHRQFLGSLFISGPTPLRCSKMLSEFVSRIFKRKTHLHCPFKFQKIAECWAVRLEREIQQQRKMIVHNDWWKWHCRSQLEFHGLAANPWMHPVNKRPHNFYILHYFKFMTTSFCLHQILLFHAVCHTKDPETTCN